MYTVPIQFTITGKYDSTSQSCAIRTPHMQSACLKSLKLKDMLAKTLTENKYIFIYIFIEFVCIFKTFVFKIHLFFSSHTYENVFGWENILKSTSYKCYCTGLEHTKCTWDHVTDQNGESWYHVSIHFYLDCSKYLKCFCIIPSAFNVKETSIKVRQTGFIYLCVLWKSIYMFVQKRRTLQEYRDKRGTRGGRSSSEMMIMNQHEGQTSEQKQL